MATKKKAMKLATELGATLEVERDEIGFTVRITAPQGYHWEEEVHQIVIFSYNGFPISDSYDDALARMSGGLESCHSECE